MSPFFSSHPREWTEDSLNKSSLDFLERSFMFPAQSLRNLRTLCIHHECQCVQGTPVHHHLLKPAPSEPQARGGSPGKHTLPGQGRCRLKPLTVLHAVCGVPGAARPLPSHPWAGSGSLCLGTSMKAHAEEPPRRPPGGPSRPGTLGSLAGLEVGVE